MNDLISFSKFLGKKFTVRDMLPHLQFACNSGIEAFFGSIMPQEEGQNPLDRELFANKRSLKHVLWVLQRLYGNNVRVEQLYTRIYSELDVNKLISSNELSKSDPLYPLMVYVTNNIGNVVQPDTVDYSNARHFCSDDRDKETNYRLHNLFANQFARLDILGISMLVPQDHTSIEFSFKSDYGSFTVGGEEYNFDQPNFNARSALFECDNKRHNVAKFYAKKFFERRAVIEKELGLR